MNWINIVQPAFSDYEKNKGFNAKANHIFTLFLQNLNFCF